VQDAAVGLAVSSGPWSMWKLHILLVEWSGLTRHWWSSASYPSAKHQLHCKIMHIKFLNYKNMLTAWRFIDVVWYLWCDSQYSSVQLVLATLLLALCLFSDMYVWCFIILYCCVLVIVTVVVCAVLVNILNLCTRNNSLCLILYFGRLGINVQLCSLGLSWQK